MAEGQASNSDGQGAKKKGSEKSKQLGVEATKSGNFPEWYIQTILRSEMIDYYDISGCYILRPWSYRIWEAIRDYFDGEIKKLGVENSYFPMFVSERALNAEKDHIEGFSPEVAWVTKSGQSDLKEPIAIRPTSETIMYPAFSKWIRGHRDLPLKLNQWANVVRWEFKHPTPFLRTREFLWQEGHTAFANKADADKEVQDILQLYANVYQEVLAVPVIKGQKSENEKFPGGDYTTTVEAFIDSSGRAIQAATSHGLGQNFAKMFNIKFEDDQGEKHLVYQNSWGLTTRSIGVMVMVHGDDKGLVLPPRAAPTQVVIVPLYFKGKDNDALLRRSVELKASLTKAGVRTTVDDNDTHNPGWKFNHWEMKGVPIRLALGPRDLEQGTIEVVRRDTSAKAVEKLEGLEAHIVALLEDIQANMFARAKKIRDDRVKNVYNWKDFCAGLESRNLVQVPWCKDKECESTVKAKTKDAKQNQAVELSADAVAQGEIVRKLKADKASKEEIAAAVSKLKELKVAAEAAEKAAKPDGDSAKAEGDEEYEPLTGAAKTLCIPYEQPALESGTPCFHCGQPAQCWVFFGRTY